MQIYWEMNILYEFTKFVRIPPDLKILIRVCWHKKLNEVKLLGKFITNLMNRKFYQSFYYYE